MSLPLVFWFRGVWYELMVLCREKRKKSYECFVDDLRRCDALGLKFYNFQYVHLPSLPPSLPSPFPSSPPPLFTTTPEKKRKQRILKDAHSPGSSVGQTSRQQSIAHIADCLNAAHRAVGGVVTVLENMVRSLRFSAFCLSLLLPPPLDGRRSALSLPSTFSLSLSFFSLDPLFTLGPRSSVDTLRPTQAK